MLAWTPGSAMLSEEESKRGRDGMPSNRRSLIYKSGLIALHKSRMYLCSPVTNICGVWP